MNKLLLIIVLNSILFSCNSNNKKEDLENKSDKLISSKDSTLKTDSMSLDIKKEEPIKPLKANFIIRQTSEADSDMPSAKVFVVCESKSFLVTELSLIPTTIPKSDYKNFQIPLNALDACGGFWAGAGDYLYLISDKNKLVVYRGFQDEGQETPGFHWRKTKEYQF